MGIHPGFAMILTSRPVAGDVDGVRVTQKVNYKELIFGSGFLTLDGAWSLGGGASGLELPGFGSGLFSLRRAGRG